MKNRIAVVMVMVMGCGSEESAEQRICVAANGCGALASANIDQCVDKLGTVDASRALTECAECLETNTCAQITGGACSANCSPFASVFASSGSNPETYDRTKRPSQLTPAERQAFCTWAVQKLGGENQEEMCRIDDHDLTVTNGTVADCVGLLTTTTCTVTMGVFEDCYQHVDSPCDFLTAPQCRPVAACTP